MTTWSGCSIKDSVVVVVVVDDNDDYDNGDCGRAQIASLRLHATHMPIARTTYTRATEGGEGRLFIGGLTSIFTETAHTRSRDRGAYARCDGEERAAGERETHRVER